MKPIVIIPARAGSKGLSGKNLMKLGGKELIRWSIDFALLSGFFSEVIVTTDCEKILGLDFDKRVRLVKRPQSLAGDESPVIDAIFHAIEVVLGPDTDSSLPVSLLQPTTPFRSAESVQQAIKKYEETKKPCVFVSESMQSPYAAFVSEDKNLLAPLFTSDGVNKRRQDYPKTYHLTGGFYISTLKDLKETKSFISPTPTFIITHDNENIDIDLKSDFLLAEALLKEYGLNIV